jgi:NAD dependent epimerase/dehydratase
MAMTLTGRSVLVTGADGFIGSRLVEELVARGARVAALAQYNSFNYWGWLEDIPVLDRVRVITGDVRDAHFCESLLRGVEIVFHLAALIPIPYSYQAPDSFVDTNVRGTLNICQAARAAGVAKLIHTSTSEVYGTARCVPMDENHPLAPQSPYSATKIGADSVALSFYHSFGLPVVIARPFNCYGPRQSARAVIPAIIIQIASGAGEVHLGDISTTRDFTYVEDTCKGFCSIAECDGGLGEVFHIGSGTEHSIAQVFETIARIMRSGARIVQDPVRVRPSGSEVLRLCCDNRKLFAATGFKPSVSLEEGLSRTVAWFREERNLARYKGHLYNV